MNNSYYLDLTKGNKKIEGIIKFLYADITNQLGSAGFPFIFIADCLPNIKLITEKLLSFSSETLTQQKVILVVTNTTANSYAAEWELLQIGINDIYNWAGEDDFKNYILFTIQRQQKISSILNISKQTVDTHRKNMLHKNNLNNTGELVAKAIRYGWI